MPTNKEGGGLRRSHERPPSWRAQGDQHIPWPADMVDEPNNCCVALRVRVASADSEGRLAVVLDLPRVAQGPALPTLLELISYRFAAPDASGEDSDTAGPRAVLEFELEQLGWIDPKCPLRLERVLDLGAPKEFIEALILPFGEREAAELSELVRSVPVPLARHQLAWEYALALERRWERRAPGGRIPCRYLDVDFRQASAAPGVRPVLLPLEL